MMGGRAHLEIGAKVLSLSEDGREVRLIALDIIFDRWRCGSPVAAYMRPVPVAVGSALDFYLPPMTSERKQFAKKVCF